MTNTTDTTDFDRETARRQLQEFRFADLFVETLGWGVNRDKKRIIRLKDQGDYHVSPIADQSGVAIFQVQPLAPGPIPDSTVRDAIHKDIEKLHREHLLIFTDTPTPGASPTASLWYWMKRDGNRRAPRGHYFFRGQSGDSLLARLHGMVIDIGEFEDNGRVPVLSLTRKLEQSFDLEGVTKKFYGEFQQQHTEFVELIQGIDNPADRRWYASVLLNRLMFIYFLQLKGFVDGNNAYLLEKLKDSKQRGKNLFYSDFLQLLFFEGFAKPEEKRTKAARARLGKICYLNGGLFLHHKLENEYKNQIRVPDKAFENLLALFGGYKWALDDRPVSDGRTINPDVLGYIFEKYINQKQFGAYYTRTEITEYMCERTVNEVVLQKLNERLGREYKHLNDALVTMDRDVCRALLLPGGILRNLSMLDPACGSGAFLIAALKTLVNITSALLGKIEFLGDKELENYKRDLQKHRSLAYEIKKRIITDNLFGVDIMDEAVEICKLRLFLALVSSVDKVEQLEPLPNIDFNVLAGNSLIGLLRVDEEKQTLFGAGGQTDYKRWLFEKNELINQVRHYDPAEHDIEFIRDDVQEKLGKLREKLNEILLTEFRDELRLQFEELQIKGKKTSRAINNDDVVALKPFHWGFEFDEIVMGRSGFDVIIANPPWEVLQADEKEFIGDLVAGRLRDHKRVKQVLKSHGVEISKKSLSIQDWKPLRNDLLKIPEVQTAWAEATNQITFETKFFKTSSQYCHQGKATVSGKLNLYALFTKQCYNLLRPGGLCGIVIPSGIYTDLGAKQLRQMLFAETEVTGLFGFENRKGIFEGVHRSFKFIILTFRKGGVTTQFPTAFMRTEVAELSGFPETGSLPMTVDLIRRLSPDSLSIMELQSERDVRIVEKMAKHPLLGEHLPDKWNIKLSQELNMTTDSDLFEIAPGRKRLPLFEGKMIHQFTSDFARPRYWVDEKQTRKRLLGRIADLGQTLDYQSYRLVLRAIARNTDERTIISAAIPCNVFCGNSALVSCGTSEKALLSSSETLLLVALLNSVTVDGYARLMVSANINMFYIYQLPVPRLQPHSVEAIRLIQRSARLTCTSPEFDDLARSAGLNSHKDGATNPVERARLRAELDGLVAHLYGLTEEEFAYILTTFPLVPEPTKVAAHNAYRDVKLGLIK